MLPPHPVYRVLIDQVGDVVWKARFERPVPLRHTVKVVVADRVEREKGHLEVAQGDLGFEGRTSSALKNREKVAGGPCGSVSVAGKVGVSVRASVGPAIGPL